MVPPVPVPEQRPDDRRGGPRELRRLMGGVVLGLNSVLSGFGLAQNIDLGAVTLGEILAQAATGVGIPVAVIDLGEGGR